MRLTIPSLAMAALVASACWSPDMPVNTPPTNPLDEAPPAKPADGETSVEPNSAAPEAPLRKNKFDEEGAKVVLARASRSAHSCIEMAEKDAPRGKPSVLVTFAGEGRSTRSTIPPPFEGTQLGQCVVRAFLGIVVLPFDGPDVELYHEVDLSGPATAPAPAPRGSKKKAPKAKK